MAAELDGGIVEGTLPQAFHHIQVLDTPRILRYRPNVDKFRVSLSDTTSDQTRQACIGKFREQTVRMNHVSSRKPYVMLALTLTDWFRRI
jgi:hypothetical protein